MIDQSAIIHFFETFPPELATFLFSTIPFVERGALPIAITVYKLPVLSAFFWTLLGNLFVIPFVLFFFTPLFNTLERQWNGLHHLIEHHIRSLEKRYAENYTKYGSILLFILVAIPLPGTGVWTAALLAVIFRMKRKPAVIAMVAGQVVALLVLLLLTQGGLAVFR